MTPALALLDLDGGINSGLEVPQVVEAVKDTDDVDTVGNGLLHKVLYHVISVMIVAEDVLSAEQHLELGILKALTELPQPVPWIFFQKTQAGVKGRAAPAFHGIVSDLVHLVHDRQHPGSRHTGRDQGLMRVTQDRLNDFNGFFLYFRHM